MANWRLTDIQIINKYLEVRIQWTPTLHFIFTLQYAYKVYTVFCFHVIRRWNSIKWTSLTQFLWWVSLFSFFSISLLCPRLLHHFSLSSVTSHFFFPSYYLYTAEILDYLICIFNIPFNLSQYGLHKFFAFIDINIYSSLNNSCFFLFVILHYLIHISIWIISLLLDFKFFKFFLIPFS